MINPELLKQLNNDPYAKAKGIKFANVADPERHHAILEAAKEVCEKMGMPIVDVVVHKGESPHGIFYDTENDYLVIGEKFQSFLKPIELRSIIAHEMDHKAKRAQSLKILESRDNLVSLQESGVDISLQVARLKDHVVRTEHEADENSIRLYGAKTMLSAIIKIEVNTATKEEIKAILWTNSELPNKWQDLVTNKLHKVAENSAFIPIRNLSERLRRVYSQIPPAER